MWWVLRVVSLADLHIDSPFNDIEKLHKIVDGSLNISIMAHCDAGIKAGEDHPISIKQMRLKKRAINHAVP